MSTILHIQSDTACYVYHFDSFRVSIEEDKEGIVEINKGRHLLSFVSKRFGNCIQRKITYEVREDNYEDFLVINLKNEEERFFSCFKVTREDIENSVSDQYGNLYSKDWSRLLRGAYLSFNEIDKRCRIICDSAFSWSQDEWTIREQMEMKRTIHSIILPPRLNYIGSCAFYGCISITELVLPASLYYIGDRAFHHCKSLVSITIPNLCKVGKDVFNSCPSLRQIESKDSTSDYRCLIDHGKLLAFAPNGIEDYSFPDNIEDIGTTLWGCSNLKRIVLPKQLTQLTRQSFVGCEGLREVVIPSVKTKIKGGTFAYCPSMEAFISDNATADKRCLIINNQLIAFAPKGLEKYSIPKGVYSISDYAFAGCVELRSIFIPDTVIAIGNYSFANSGLRSLYVPDNVKQLGEGVFGGCASLLNIRLSPNIRLIKSCVFSRCNALMSIAFLGETTFLNCAICRCPHLYTITFHGYLEGMDVKDNGFTDCGQLQYVFVPKGRIKEFEKKLPERLLPHLCENPRLRDKNKKPYPE